MAVMNAYKVLGVSPSSSSPEIRKAYIKLCRKWHPDRSVTGEETDIRKRTVKMYRLNAAKDILLSEERRAQHDQELRDGPAKPGSGSGYRDPSGFHYSNKPRPSGLGVPYTGQRSSPETLSFSSDGAHGVDGLDGRRGWNGDGYGGSGSPGTNAEPATCGKHAGDMKIHLAVTVNDDGSFEVDLQHIRNMQELIDLSQNNIRSVPLKAFGTLDWSATGGKGGNGGRGGDGGFGAKGYSGRDATEYSNGTNGGPGGRGGDGGLGTHGADGGRGGDVEIHLDKDDTYLLMRVEGVHPWKGPQGRIEGGRGGSAGEHGKGGRGGAGGRGGSSHSWTTTKYITTYSNGQQQRTPQTKYHYNPGGMSGRSGKPGITPNSPLHMGADGARGSLTIKVKFPGGKIVDYPSRYDLEFNYTETEHLSNMRAPKTYEFGETVFIEQIKVNNTGKMELPKQRVLIQYGTVEGVKYDTAGKIFLREGKNIAPGGSDFADEGYLEFSCPYPSNPNINGTKTIAQVTDFDPIRRGASFLYRAYQLGHENNTTDITKISDFQARYMEFQDEAKKDSIQMSFPVENPDGLRGFRSLGQMETTILECTLRNVTEQDFGEASQTQRAVVAQLYYADEHLSYEIPIDKIRIRAEEGKIVGVKPLMTNKGKGYRYVVPFIPAGGDFTVQLSLKLNDTNIQVSEAAGLQLDLYIQKIPQLCMGGDRVVLTKKHLVQRRLFVVSCQPRFQPDLQSDIVLVTTTGSTAAQVSAWQSLFARLGLTAVPYSLSRYGHFNSNIAVEGVAFREALKDKLVVVLNDIYIPKPNTQEERLATCHPSELLKSVYELPCSTHLLIVGGCLDPVSHLAPAASALHTDDVVHVELSNMKNCRKTILMSLDKERSTGFSLERETPKGFDVTVKRKSFSPPSKEVIARVMKARAKKMKRYLKKTDPLRPYSVEWSAKSASTQAKQAGFYVPRNIGTLHITAGPPRSQNVFSFVEEQQGTTRGYIAKPTFIQGRPMMYATLQALSFQAKMARFSRNLVFLAENSNASSDGKVQDSQLILELIKDCIVGDFVQDVTNYHHGKMKVENALHRSPTVLLLRRCESLNELIAQADSNDSLRGVMTTHLSKLTGAMRCVARSKDLRPWFKPFSRKHQVSKHVLEAIDDHLVTHWDIVLDKDLIEKEQSRLKGDARALIKSRKKSMFTMFGIRGRWRAALTAMHSPTDAANNILVRRESGLLATGNTTKIRKCTTRVLDPSQTYQEVRAYERKQLYRESVRTTTADEYELYVQKDSPSTLDPSTINVPDFTHQPEPSHSKPFHSEGGVGGYPKRASNVAKHDQQPEKIQHSVKQHYEDEDEDFKRAIRLSMQDRYEQTPLKPALNLGTSAMKEPGTGAESANVPVPQEPEWEIPPTAPQFEWQHEWDEMSC